ncbi:hypothetical protein, partial [Providencia rustigianii]|uniref:hypothetical protein n=1 Tax=Providencia rustigianii TaxID=158850 RepID=UPI00223F50F3
PQPDAKRAGQSGERNRRLREPAQQRGGGSECHLRAVRYRHGSPAERGFPGGYRHERDAVHRQ